MVQVNVMPSSRSVTDKPSVEPTIGLNVYVLAFTAVIGGFLFGYDTGIVSSAMLYVPNNSGMRPMNTIWQEVIVSITPGIAAIGSLLSGPGSDRFGRKKIIIGSSFIFTIGALICGISVGKYFLLLGRTLLGIAIGFASMIVPVYVGEASPCHIRGTLVTGFQLMITFGLLAANVFAGAFSYINPENIGWRLMFGFAAIPAVIQFIAFFYLPESPRWLFENGRKDEAEEVLSQIYSGNKQWITYEMAEIAAAFDQEQMEKNEHSGSSSIFGRILVSSHVRKALIVGCLLQAFQQLSGINTIMYYTGKIIQSAGIQNNHTIIWISAGISGVNFCCTLIPMYLIERVGRRRLLITSIVGVSVTLLLMGGAFLMINRDSDITTTPSFPIGNHLNEQCLSLSNCDFCVTEENCGFCQNKGENMGYCLPHSLFEGDKTSLFGPCSDLSNETNSSFEWSTGFCHTQYTFIPIILMVIYLSFFSSGYAPLPWVMNAEFYPLWARSTCVSISTATNWIFNLIISLTFLTLSQAVSKYGTFFIYAGITSIALLFVIIFVPETKNYGIDEVELLFMSQKKRREVEQNIRHRTSLALGISDNFKDTEMQH